RVISNLLVNAMRHGSPPIVVTAKLSESSVRIAVEDGGPGVPEQLQAHLFERFARGDDPRGSGLRLTISRAYPRAHGGGRPRRRPPRQRPRAHDLPRVRPRARRGRPARPERARRALRARPPAGLSERQAELCSARTNWYASAPTAAPTSGARMYSQSACRSP